MTTGGTVIKYLFLFDRQAILNIAQNRLVILAGFFFVISAGFAREYDGEYLVAEPWHVFIPVVASTIACTALVICIYGLARLPKSSGAGFGEIFKSFLALFWLTAPLAWLYAIPFERFLSAGDATRANLSVLAIVAAWRVALMVRCVQVLFNARFFSALIPVMLFSDAVALLALWLVPAPVFMIMGGVRLTESENVILGMRLCLGLTGFVTLPIWLVSYSVLSVKNREWLWQATANDDDERQSKRVSTGLWILVAISILVWIPIVPNTQKEQWLRWRGDQLIRSGEFEEFAQLTRDHVRDEFPPHWDPPPRLGYRETEPDLIATTAGLVAANTAKWILDQYGEKLNNQASRDFVFFQNLRNLSDDELALYVNTIAALGNGSEIAASLRPTAESMMAQEGLSEKRKQILENLLKLDDTNTD